MAAPAATTRTVRRVLYSDTALEAGLLRRALEQEPGTTSAADHVGPSLLSARIADAVIGAERLFTTPLGFQRRIVYCDYVASGRALSFIEDYVREEVLPMYGNTHTTTSATGLQTTCFRHEARDIVKQACNASEEDALIFVGSGSTAAVVKLRDALQLHRYDGVRERPVVFVGPFEHHSNLLPWREAPVDVVQIGENSEGRSDTVELTRQLQQYSGRPLRIGSFSAASNVTGVLEDQDAVTACLHQHGALAFWDFASAGPYVKVDMNPIVQGYSRTMVQKDAIFISPHKFVGGIGTPGVLIAKSCLFDRVTPHGPGGGSVFYVTREDHRYLQETEWREEAGTPAIVESIRCGLVFQLKEAVGVKHIEKQEALRLRKGFDVLGSHPSIRLLGPGPSTSRLPIFSFLIQHEATGLFLHHNFVAALLNDMFGIQSRGGCACAGPYAQELMGIDHELSKRFESALLDNRGLEDLLPRDRDRINSGKELLRPGFVRISLNYFVDEAQVDFVLSAIRLVADIGWCCLPQYTFNPDTGDWKHRKHDSLQARTRRWLGAVSYTEDGMSRGATPEPPVDHNLPSGREYYNLCLREGTELLKSYMQKTRLDQQRVAGLAATSMPDQNSMLTSDEERQLRWFLFPAEACNILKTFSPGQDINPPARTSLVLKPYTETDAEALSSQSTDENIGIVRALTSSAAESAVRKRRRSPPTKPRTSTSACCGSRQSPSGHRAGRQATVTTDDKQTSRTSSKSCQTLPAEISSNVDDERHNQVASQSTHVAAENLRPASVVKATQITSRVTEHEHKSTESRAPIPVATAPAPFSAVSHRNSPSTNTATVATWDFVQPPKAIIKKVYEAITEHKMIQDGDRILIGVSGGKDSLTLVHVLQYMRRNHRWLGVNFEFGCVTVDPQTPAFDPSPLKVYFQALGIPYFYEEQQIIKAAQQAKEEVSSICSFCSRMKRGRLYACLRREGYNVLALGQHLDDLAESFMMSAFHNGFLRTMKANYTNLEGDIRIIRPFVATRERDIRAFAVGVNLPIIAENCPACFSAPTERARIKQLLAAQEHLFPDLYNSLRTAMKPLMSITETGQEKQGRGC